MAPVVRSDPADHEKAAHGIGDLDPQHAFCNLGGEHAGAGARLVETVGAAAFDITTADHEVALAGLQQGQHLRQLRLVVLQVGIDHRGVGRARCEDSLDAGAGQGPRRPIRRIQRTRASCCARPRTTSQAPGELSSTKMTSKRNSESAALHTPKQRDDVVALVEGDHSKLQETRGLRRGFGARSDGFLTFMRKRNTPARRPVMLIRRFRKFRAVRGGNGGQNSPKMPTTTNRARTSGALPSHSVASSQRRSYEGSDCRRWERYRDYRLASQVRPGKSPRQLVGRPLPRYCGRPRRNAKASPLA